MTPRAIARTAAGLLVLSLVVGCSAGPSRNRPAAAAQSSVPGPPAAAATAAGAPAPASARPAVAPSADARLVAPAPAGAPAGTIDPASDRALAPFYQQKLVWKGCGGRFVCTSATVPLDYRAPAGRRIQIAMIKLPARSARGRIGSLFINPGGPGGSGVDYARYAESAIPKPVRDRFDIVGFDPRGVGLSAPIRCGTPAQLDRWTAPDPSPDDPAELRQLTAAAKAFAAGCAQRSGPLLGHVSTRDSARDLDVMRAAVGDAKLTYLGKSYGTYLGALYAELFHSRVRALILDGAVDPTVDTQTLGRVQARGFEVALSAFLDDCARSQACVFGRKADIRGRFDSLLARIEKTPLSTSTSRTVGPTQVYYAVAEALYSKQYGWPALRVGLAQAERGDGSTLLALFDSYVDRDDDGKYSNLLEAYTAISCLDRPSLKDLSAYAADARTEAAESPHFGAAAAYGALPCAYWPVPPIGPPAPLHARGAAPILVIGTTRDPATPLLWSAALAKQLRSGRLLTFNGHGHTAYGDGNACVDNAGNSYLVAAKLPAVGTRCG